MRRPRETSPRLSGLQSVMHPAATPHRSRALGRLALAVALPLLAVGAVPASLVGATSGTSDARHYTGPTVAGELAEPANLETSGLAASHRTPGLVWTHDDSGGEPVLFAMRSTGYLVGRMRLAGTVNRDWEDLAAFTLDGQCWLLVADTGDNDARYPQSVLHVLAEPDLDTLMSTRELSLAPAYSIVFRYEDRPHDCEAVAVDPAERAVYLLTKRDQPPQLFRLPLAAASPGQPAIARAVGTVTQLPRARLADKITGKLPRALRGHPTALDFSPDGAAALVLTYGGVFLFPRAPGTSWAEALAAKPAPLPPFSLPQAEAAAFAADGRAIYLASEKSRQLLRYDRAP